MAIHTPEMTATETVPVDTETAVNISADAAPLTAPEGPNAAAPDTDTTDGTNARVEAVLAVLESLPGGSATGLGAAAGLSRVAAGKLLNQMEVDGLVRREAGGHDGQSRGRTPDRWFLVTADAPDTETPDADAPDADAVPASEEEATPYATDTADAPADEPTDEEDLTEEAAGQPEDLSADEAAGQDSVGTDSDLDPDLAADADASEPVADDPAWARVKAELAELSDLFGGVILAKGGGNAVMALGCLEMAMTKVASVHRNARAVLTGTAAAPARSVSAARSGTASGVGAGDVVRPGVLRDMVHAHLIEFPGKDFTPYEIGRALDRSSGAVANALDRLVSLGDAVLSCERPRRFALAPTANPTATPAGAPAEAAAPGAPGEADAEGGAGADTYGG